MSAPEEAVQIVRKILGPVPYRGTDRAVVDALSDAGWLHDPAEVAALRAELAKVKQHRAELSDRCYRKDLELDELRLLPGAGGPS